MLAWKMRTARSSDEDRSQIHMVVGASSSLVAKRDDDASNNADAQPTRSSVPLPLE